MLSECSWQRCIWVWKLDSLSWMVNMPCISLPRSLPASPPAWFSLPDFSAARSACVWFSSFLPPPLCVMFKPQQKNLCWYWQCTLVMKTGHCFPKQHLVVCTWVHCLGYGLQGGFVNSASWAARVPGCPQQTGMMKWDACVGLFLSSWLPMGDTPWNSYFIGFWNMRRTRFWTLKEAEKPNFPAGMKFLPSFFSAKWNLLCLLPTFGGTGVNVIWRDIAKILRITDSGWKTLWRPSFWHSSLSVRGKGTQVCESGF